MEFHSSRVETLRQAQRNNFSAHIPNIRSFIDNRETGTHVEEQSSVTSTYRLVKSLKIKAHNNISYFEIFKKTLEHTIKELKTLSKETTAQSIIDTLWKILLPSAPQNRTILPQNSTELFLTALLEAETKNEGISKDAIYMLLNFWNEPLVSNIAVLYLETTFEEQLDVVSSPIPYVSEPTAVHSINLSKHRPMYSSSLQKITCFLLLGLKKRFLILLVTLLLILLMVVFTCLMRHLNTPRTESANKSGSQQHSVSTQMSTTEMTLDETKLDDFQNFLDRRVEPYDMHVTSFKDLMEKLQNVTSAAPISLKIISHTAGVWLNKKFYGDFSKIEELEIGGEVSILDVMEILTKMSYARTVVLTNDGNRLCILSREIVKLFTRKELKHIRKLVLKGLTTCSNVYQYLSYNIVLSALHDFVMDECVVEDENSIYIQAMLHNSRDTLEYIEFSRTVFLTSLINHKLRTFGEVRSLKLDILNGKNARNIVYIPRQIHHIFPFLEIFNSSSGYFPLDEFTSLAQCSKLKSIQIGLHVSGNPNRFEVDILFQDIPSVTTAKLAFKVSETNYEYDCIIVGLSSLKKRMHTLEVRSNCTIEY